MCNEVVVFVKIREGEADRETSKSDSKHLREGVAKPIFQTEQPFP